MPRGAHRKAVGSSDANPGGKRKKNGVSEGNRTPDPQNHNLVL